jgi:hypothetical protein
MKKFLCGIFAISLSCVFAQDLQPSQATAAGAKQSTDAKTAAAQQQSELDRLRAQILEQQAQLERLQKAIADENQLLKSLSSGQLPPATPDPSLRPNLGQIASATPMVPPTPAPLPPPPQQPGEQQAGTAPASPLQIHVGDATITPVGFMDLTNTWRSTNSGASLATNFGNFPYNNAVTGRLSEDKISAQNSRLGLRVDAKVHGYNLMGYYEGDFVGQVAVNNTQVTSNPMGYRIRLYWVDVRKGKFEFLAGQSWSLMTPNRNGLSALPGDLFYGQEMDVNYLNGLTWTRNPGVRFLYHPSKQVTMGISLENSDQYAGGSGGAGTPTLPSAFASNTFNNEIDANQTNDITIPSVHPDIIAKIAIEPVRPVHFEIAGIESTFKTFNPTTQQYFTVAGGGGAVNANVAVTKNLRLITNNFWSDGEGRYIFGQAPDLIIRADGSPSLVHSGSTVDGFEAQAGKFQFYTYYGGTYIGRDVALDANGTSLIGWGYHGSANSQNRAIQEVTFGWIHTLWRDPRYGALQYITQYAYFMRDPWYLSVGAPKNTHQNTIWFDFRYTLPGSAPTVEY